MTHSYLPEVMKVSISSRHSITTHHMSVIIIISSSSCSSSSSSSSSGQCRPMSRHLRLTTRSNQLVTPVVVLATDTDRQTDSWQCDGGGKARGEVIQITLDGSVIT